MMNFFTHNLIWKHGLYILIMLGSVAFIGFLFFLPILYIALGFIFFSLYFFRNPTRICPEYLQDNKIIICPADGKVVALEQDIENSFEGYAQKISIFLSPLDVHVNWAPITGRIIEVTYTPGKFLFAFLPKSSNLNEHNDVIIQTHDGKSIKIRQIAGTIARRICCWVSKDESIKAGDTFGMIRFGSRIDIFLPSDVTIAVQIKQTVYGGQTVLGRWQ